MKAGISRSLACPGAPTAPGFLTSDLPPAACPPRCFRLPWFSPRPFSVASFGPETHCLPERRESEDCPGCEPRPHGDCDCLSVLWLPTRPRAARGQGPIWLLPWCSLVPAPSSGHGTRGAQAREEPHALPPLPVPGHPQALPSKDGNRASVFHTDGWTDREAAGQAVVTNRLQKRPGCHVSHPELFPDASHRHFEPH